MNILFLTMSEQMLNLSASGIYTDLTCKLRDEGHNVYVMIPYERRIGKNTQLCVVSGVHMLGVRTLNVVKTNIIEKGIGQVLLEYQFSAAFKKYLSNIKFDLILYSTPPITFTKVIKTVKKSCPKAKSYLMLKDIFPQNAVDLGMMSKSGLKGLLYRSFRRKEKELYKISDFIGCMSPANVMYVIEHNPEVDASKVELCPNSYALPKTNSDKELTNNGRSEIRLKYNLPIDKPIFIYGGNLGKPQGIPFLIDCLDYIATNRSELVERCHFLIVGNGTEYPKIETWINENKPRFVSLFQRLPKEDYDHLANACDVGLIFLDYRFTIPNYPSRLLPYLMGKKPIIACTDPNCDTGYIAEENGYGFGCPSNDEAAFAKCVQTFVDVPEQIIKCGACGYHYFLKNYTVDNTYQAIMQHF